MNKETLEQNIIEAINLFNTELNKLFPEQIIINDETLPKRNIYAHKPQTGITSSTITFNWYSCNKKQSSLDHLNSINIRFIMHTQDSYYPSIINDKFSIEVLTCDYRLKGLKFRKLTSKTPLDTVKKLIHWFIKNQETLNNQPLYKAF
jgi:hypothetical protein